MLTCELAVGLPFPLLGEEIRMKLHNHILMTFLAVGCGMSTGFAQTPASTPADSQSQPARTSTSHPEHTATDKASSTAKHAAEEAESMVGKSDKEFLTKAAQGGMMEVQLAQMAQQKAVTQEVKDFGKKLEQDHTKANEKLKEIAKERNVDLPSDIGAEQQSHVSKLSNLSGAEFDQAYMNMMVKDHKKDIKEFEKEANRGMDSSVKEFASSTLPTLKEHLDMAQQINSSTRSRKADTATDKIERTDKTHSTDTATPSTGKTGADTTDKTDK